MNLSFETHPTSKGNPNSNFYSHYSLTTLSLIISPPKFVVGPRLVWAALASFVEGLHAASSPVSGDLHIKEHGDSGDLEPSMQTLMQPLYFLIFVDLSASGKQ